MDRTTFWFWSGLLNIAWALTLATLSTAVAGFFPVFVLLLLVSIPFVVFDTFLRAKSGRPAFKHAKDGLQKFLRVVLKCALIAVGAAALLTSFIAGDARLIIVEDGFTIINNTYVFVMFGMWVVISLVVNVLTTL